MARPRDGQQSKVLSAILGIRPGAPELNNATSVAFINKITRSAWWKKRSTWHQFEVIHGAQYCETGKAGLLRIGAHLTRVDVLHALTHKITPTDVALHGPEFAKEFLNIVERYLGAQYKAQLLVQYKNRGVKYRTWSPEAKERARERAAKHGTPFGLARLEEAQEGVLSILGELAGGLTPAPTPAPMTQATIEINVLAQDADAIDRLHKQIDTVLADLQEVVGKVTITRRKNVDARDIDTSIFDQETS